jgi:hypothetical protein
MMKPATMPLLWSAILGLTAALGSYGLACVFPFAALAALAAVTLPARQAIVLMGAVWAVNQVVGFTLLGYASGDHAVSWGLVIGAAAFLALVAAKAVAGERLLSVRSLAALAAAICAYQLVMFVGAYALDGFASSTPEIVATVACNDVLWFAGLATLRLALGAGLPRWFGTPRTA